MIASRKESHNYYLKDKHWVTARYLLRRKKKYLFLKWKSPNTLEEHISSRKGREEMEGRHFQVWAITCIHIICHTITYIYNPYNTCIIHITHVIVHIKRERFTYDTIGPKALDLLKYSHIIISFQPCSTTWKPQGHQSTI